MGILKRYIKNAEKLCDKFWKMTKKIVFLIYDGDFKIHAGLTSCICSSDGLLFFTK